MNRCTKKYFYNLVEDYKKINGHVIEVLQEAKKLKIPGWNLMSNEDLQKAIKGTIIKFKEIMIALYV